MIAVKLPSETAAQNVSRGLWRLSRPAAIAAGETTQFLAAWVVQPDTTALLILDPDWTLPIHGLTAAQIADVADGAGTRAALAALLTPLLTSPGAALATLRALLTSGAPLTIGDLVALIKPALVVNPYIPPTVAGP